MISNRISTANSVRASALRRAQLLLCLSLLLALFAHPTPVWACSCAETLPPPTAFAHATAVFSGQVTHILDKQSGLAAWLEPLRVRLGLPHRYGYDSPVYGYQVTLAVATSWKGITTTRADLTTGYGGGDCGYTFRVGRDYVLYTYGAPNDLQTHICSRTTELSHAAADLSYLSTLPALPLSPVRPTPWLLLGGLALVIALGLWVTVAYGQRHRDRTQP